MCLNATIPLFFELALETVYPDISEGTGSGLLSYGITIVQIVYLAIPQLAAPSSAALNLWLMVLVTPVFTAPLCMMVAHYPRLDVDESVDLKSASKLERGIVDRAGCF